MTNTIKITGFMPYDKFEGENYLIASSLADKLIRIYTKLDGDKTVELIRTMTQDEVISITIN